MSIAACLIQSSNISAHTEPSAPLSLDTSARQLSHIGPRRVRLFARLLNLGDDLSVGELLTLYPRDYQDRRRLSRIKDLRPGIVSTFYGQLTGPAVDRRTATGKSVTQAPVSDGSGVLLLCWFNQPYIKKKLRIGDRYILTGKVESFGAEMRITQPDLEKMDDTPALSGGRIVPVYPLTEGLQQPTAREALREALDKAAAKVPELLPEGVIRQYNLMGIRDALENIHFPTTPEALEAATRRLKFEELFLVQCLLALRKQEDQSRPGIKLTIDEPIAAEIRRMVPFQPTGAQKRVVREIFRDLVRPVPMNRLLQGDVGSGKTLVAAIAVVAAVRNGCQAALMAPTEILAEQHATTFRRLLEPLGIPVWLLTGSVPAREREPIHESLQRGEPGIVLGTQALIQEGVRFSRLALAIVDEQHRFGVEQRLKLQQGGATGEGPHVLVMTATPIPRTLSLTAYGHLDVSIIDEMPPGRTPIQTRWMPHSGRKEVYRFVQEQVRQGRQAYVVCPLVESSEKMDAVSAIEWHAALRSQVLPDIEVGLLHGRLKSIEKESIMDQFRRGQIQVLTATTVIEVGVDVPNATVMVIEDANRFGLAQLHQLRGRVGRGQYEGSCFLVTEERYNPAGAGSRGKLALDE
ncbi:MAG: ATP-dependent DNA helicase RecG, partial [Armatimonadota bacterium]|nr:ATP-dependent DNA helicase RecG [Armatimonadota bacterium]